MSFSHSTFLRVSIQHSFFCWWFWLAMLSESKGYRLANLNMMLCYADKTSRLIRPSNQHQQFSSMEVTEVFIQLAEEITCEQITFLRYYSIHVHLPPNE